MEHKIWNYVYKDDVVVVNQWDPDMEAFEDFRTAKNPPIWEYVSQMDTTYDYCYLYTDKEIVGLPLMGTNKRVGEIPW